MKSADLVSQICDSSESNNHIFQVNAKTNEAGYIVCDKDSLEPVMHKVWEKVHGFHPDRLKNVCGRRDCLNPKHWKHYPICRLEETQKVSITSAISFGIPIAEIAKGSYPKMTEWSIRKYLKELNNA